MISFVTIALTAIAGVTLGFTVAACEAMGYI